MSCSHAILWPIYCNSSTVPFSVSGSMGPLKKPSIDHWVQNCRDNNNLASVLHAAPNDRRLSQTRRAYSMATKVRSDLEVLLYAHMLMRNNQHCPKLKHRGLQGCSVGRHKEPGPADRSFRRGLEKAGCSGSGVELCPRGRQLCHQRHDPRRGPAHTCSICVDATTCTAVHYSH